jgi:hypothetical protein
MAIENASKARRGLRRGSIGSSMSALVFIAFRLLPLPACFGCCYPEFVLGTLKFAKHFATLVQFD